MGSKKNCMTRKSPTKPKRTRKKSVKNVLTNMSTPETSFVDPSMKTENDQDTGLLTDKYLALHKDYTEKYGNIALLMQVGSFYECYSDADESFGNAREVAQVLNMRLTRKKKSKEDSPFMTGFPCAVSKDHIPILLSRGFTVIVMDQHEVEPDVYTRQVTNVVSKGTDLDSSNLTNNVLACYYRDDKGGNVSLAFAHVDVTISRQIVCHSVISHPQDPGLALDSAIEYITQVSPVETVFICDLKTQQIVSICRDLDIKSPIIKTSHAFRDDDAPNDIEMVAVGALKEYLQERFFDIDEFEVTNYVPQEFLDMTSTAIHQLDIPILIETVDFTLTRMGKRLLRDRLMRPLLSVEALNKSYDAITNMDDKLLDRVRMLLKGCPDIEKLHRKISLGKLQHPQHIAALHEIYSKVTRLFQSGSGDDILPGFDIDKELLSKLCQEVTDNINLDVCDERFTWDLPLLKKTKEVKSLFTTKDNFIKKLSEIQANIEAALSKNGKIYMKENDLTGFKTTPSRAKIIEKEFKDTFQYLGSKNETTVTNEGIRENLTQLAKVKATITNKSQVAFKEFLIDLQARYEVVMKRVVAFLSELDFIQSAKKAANEFRYARPTILHEKDKGFPNQLTIKQLRHAVIERLHTDHMYIANDVVLSETETLGYTLWGANASGKTSLLKAVGISVVMAQAGMFVPAAEMQFTLFKRIMTRISGGDNLLRGQSSFVVECEEIRSIVQRADRFTLVLGDEMCRGTEVESATAMVYTLIRMLVENKVQFLAATHLFALSEHLQKMHPQVRMFHTKTSIEPSGEVVYRRNLEEGPGRKLYGLEIARALQFPKNYLKIAMEFRNATNPLPSATTKKSKYNAQKVLVKCELCGYRPLEAHQLPLDTHHMDFQCNASPEGFHGVNHKHATHNLVALCKPCHVKVHTEKNLVLEQVQTPQKNFVRSRINGVVETGLESAPSPS